MIESWKDIPDMEGFYQASDLGSIRSVDRIVRNKYSTKTVKGRVLKQRAHSYGYPMVTLSMNNKKVHRTVHSLVALTFIGPRPEGHHVRHRDGNSRNSVLTNLIYGTPTDNSHDRLDHGTFLFGENIHSAVLTEARVVEIRARRAVGESLSDLAIAFGQTEANICKIVIGAKWKRVGGPLTRAIRKQKRLSDLERQEVVAKHKSGMTYAMLARQFDVSETQIKNIVRKV